MPNDKKPLTCVEMGRIGGAKAAANMTPEQRKKRAKKAVLARWKKVRAAKKAAEQAAA